MTRRPTLTLSLPNCAPPLQLPGEAWGLFDDVKGIVDRGGSAKVLLALCPYKNNSASFPVASEAAAMQPTTVLLLALYPGNIMSCHVM
jgi:hypothetical protein